MNTSLSVSEMPPTAGQRLSPESASDRPTEAFDLPHYAELTYQEYTYCPHAEPVDAWLCESLGICGGNHV